MLVLILKIIKAYAIDMEPEEEIIIKKKVKAGRGKSVAIWILGILLIIMICVFG